jgi:hypothetical protein
MAHTDFRTALQNDNTIEISVTGRTSGRPISLPIWFAVDGDTLYLIPLSLTLFRSEGQRAIGRSSYEKVNN